MFELSRGREIAFLGGSAGAGSCETDNVCGAGSEIMLPGSGNCSEALYAVNTPIKITADKLIVKTLTAYPFFFRCLRDL